MFLKNGFIELEKKKMSEQSHTKQGEVKLETWAVMVWEHDMFGQRNTLLPSWASPWATGKSRTPRSPTSLLLLAKANQVASISPSKITPTLGNNRISEVSLSENPVCMMLQKPET